ncbi:G/U mismatch-specific DNA glycosylase [Pantoea sp. LMR881]|uniref:G/U mismatch-specific DNA glycosylase n=1 Tax=Pantoea sp. LMR881 TaxID=3014336 RepID=UPI0022AF210A|nr:G/U mismatch-specific DNA glycosylase [Pantoea sp. LMR881]MCZ4060160.1 G/U mismatch-specific DNA glycosylase [Pantoea sp. LMR881]
MSEHNISDIIATDLNVLFCGINPGYSTAHSGYHFAHPGNRFWRVIHLAGFTHQQLKPEDEHKLLETGCGITMLVERPTVQANQLAAAELREGGQRLMKKVLHYQPKALAILGKDAFKRAFQQSKVEWGAQPTFMGKTQVWVLPNPSGLNRASLAEIVEAYQQLQEAVMKRSD